MAAVSPAHPVPARRAAQRRPAPLRARSEVTAPPASAPVIGGGVAAAAAGTAGGGVGASLMVAATLLLLFTLSTPVSLDISAWRSTLLSLRLERPG
jgi:hypothetical protein